MGDDAHWYKDAVFYELHVKSFADSNGDGIGDFRGPDGAARPPRSELGVDCLWLLPMYPSPFRDDGYDIADYYDIHPSYGTLEDFTDASSSEAHARGPARDHRAGAQPHLGPAPVVPGGPQRRRDSPHRDCYVWSDTDDRYRDVRIIFRDTERSNWAWDPVSQGLLLAPLLQPPARPQLRQSRRARGDLAA